MSADARPRDAAIIVFDGVCVLCNGWVRFLLARDPQGRLRYAAMQTAAGRALLQRHGLDPDDPASLLLIDDGVARTGSDAVLRVLTLLGGPWRWLSGALRLCPRRLRDPLYRLVARNRYRWFGRHQVCSVPDAQTRERFLS